jgi:hypothetical protein
MCYELLLKMPYFIITVLLEQNFSFFSIETDLYGRLELLSCQISSTDATTIGKTTLSMTTLGVKIPNASFSKATVNTSIQWHYVQCDIINC